MKINLLKITRAAGLCLLLAAVSANAQTVIGSWQGATTDDGWIDWGNTLSITNAANTTKYTFPSGVVAGYTKSLNITQAGYQQNLAIKLEYKAGGIAAFLANNKLNFTFSVDSAATSGSTSGYSQVAQLAINATGYGFNAQSFSQFSATGDTGNNTGGQPNYYFYGGAPARSQVVTVDYSSIKSAITATTNGGYIELIFTFNNGGGAPANFYINNVTLSGAPNTVTFVIDDFATTGVTSSNPANDDYYYDNKDSLSVNYPYNTGQITNVWAKWFGNALTNVTWDASDANSTAGSGSMKLQLDWSQDSQFVLWNQGPNNNYFQVNANCATTYTNLQCDVKFAAGSASDIGNGTAPGGTTTGTFGHLRFGNRTSSYGQEWFGAVDVLATNTGWVHVSIPLDAVTYPSLTNLNGLLINIDKNYYNLNLTGGSTIYIDNIKLVGPSTAITVAPPTVKIAPATRGLRIFAGSTANTYDREELTTVDQNQSWIGGGFPKTYSFKLNSAVNRNGFQTHMFLIPVNTANSSITGNEYLDYNAKNSLWLQINGSTNGNCTANISWKTNLPNANPDHLALNITNGTAVGTWTVTFNSATTGTLTAPGASAAAFTIADPAVATDFANPLVAIFGLQPQDTAAYGTYVDYANINITGVAGSATADNFTTQSALGANWDTSNSAYPDSLVLVGAGNPYWVNWNLPDDSFGLGTAPDLTSGNWYLPGYYNGYANGNYSPFLKREGNSRWILITADSLPTTNTVPGAGVSPNAFYQLFNPPLSN